MREKKWSQQHPDIMVVFFMQKSCENDGSNIYIVQWKWYVCVRCLGLLPWSEIESTRRAGERKREEKNHLKAIFYR